MDFVSVGLAFDDWDLDYYTQLFKEKIKRNPTNVECFDLAQSNRYLIYMLNLLLERGSVVFTPQLGHDWVCSFIQINPRKTFHDYFFLVFFCV